MRALGIAAVLAAILFAAGSLHANNICNIALADGSVKGLNPRAIDSLSLSYITGTKDGQVQGTDF